MRENLDIVLEAPVGKGASGGGDGMVPWLDALREQYKRLDRSVAS